ncbi:MAG: hypothetical protein HYX44_11735 [Aquabacterium sp.]|nr:hypothetical protein [Aquabacterium sp.]
MSQHSGGRLARHHTPDRPGRPSLERPSLFAGMDDEPSRFDGDTQRVRILSTLESTRRPARGPMKIYGVTKKKRGNWQTKALVALMLLGVLSLLASLVVVLLNGRAAEPASPSKAPAANAKALALSSGGAKNPLAALMAAPPRVQASNQTNHQVGSPPAQAPTPGTQTAVIAAVIENIPASPLPDKATQASAPPATTLALAAPASAQTRKQAPAEVPAKVPTLAPETGKPARPAATASKRVASAGHADDDVALLEAMFAHTRPRPAAESAADEIRRRCSGLSGADAATCRARVCVQNPTAAVCHQD